VIFIVKPDYVRIDKNPTKGEVRNETICHTAFGDFCGFFTNALM
jgi:hypothetical protein